MQQTSRRTLSIKTAPALAADAGADEILRQAILRKLCATAVYNKAAVRLAPHILYSRHDEPFVDAQVIERDGKAPREIKLGVFKLAGLKDVRLTQVPFRPLTSFNAGDPLYTGTTIATVAAAG